MDIIMEKCIEYVSLSPADNGLILNWSEKTYPEKGSFENAKWKDNSLVFKEGEIDKALDKFKELWKAYYQDRKEDRKEGSIKSLY